MDSPEKDIKKKIIINDEVISLVVEDKNKKNVSEKKSNSNNNDKEIDKKNKSLYFSDNIKMINVNDNPNNFLYNKLKKENAFEFQYVNNNSIYEQLISENKILMAKINNIEIKYNKEIEVLRNERINSNLLGNNNKIGINGNDHLQKQLKDKENEIKIYKMKVKDFEKKNKLLEDEIFKLNLYIKKFENDYTIVKKDLEIEKNKNMVNNIILKAKGNEIIFDDYKHNYKDIKNNEKIENKENYNSCKLNNKNLNEDKIKYGKVGLINYGFNCYMNSIIQILKNIKKFAFNILKYDKDDVITVSLRKLLVNLYYSDSKLASIQEFKKDFGSQYNKFADDKENDSTIFLLYLLQHLNKVFKLSGNYKSSIDLFRVLNLNSSEKNKLEIFLNKYQSNNNSYINEIFYGYEMNKIICIKCGYCHTSFQSFNILNLPIIYETTEVISLEQSLNCYLVTKDRRNTEGFECTNCKTRFLSHLTCIIKLPQILIINLKRVGENTVYYHEIEIPMILKTKLIDKLNIYNKQYELIGFIKHFGNEKNGHNIAFSKNIFDNKWYSFNDSIVKEVQSECPSTDKSFLLFYQIIDN